MDEAAVARSYEQHAGAVYARCLRILRDRDAARDVTQEVFVRCFGHRFRLRDGGGGELLAWLYRVATNLCLNLLRDRDLRRRAHRDVPPPAPVAPAGPAARELRDRLDGLDRRTQEIVVYVYLDGMTHAEAARVAKVSDRTVRACLARFQQRGRQRFGNAPEPVLGEGSK